MTTGSFADTLSSNPDLFAGILPEVYFSKYLSLPSSPARPPSLRGVHEFRHCTMHAGALAHTLGSAVVRMGNSIAVCGITAYVVDSDGDDDDGVAGGLFTNVDALGRTGPPTPELMSMSEWMVATARSVKLYDREQLRVAGTAQQWLTLQAQIQLLGSSQQGQQQDGYDVAWAALIAGLRATRLPRAVVADDEESRTADFGTEPEIKFDRAQASRLVLNYADDSLPWCVNFGVWQRRRQDRGDDDDDDDDDNELVLADLEGRVEQASVDGRISIITTANDKTIESISVAAGKTTITKRHVQKCIELARARAGELNQILGQVVKEI
ncbi:hypothetical protein V1514DRAFT_288608 [Lipomyces japonicus]|uniref:uncharacterized protein n=1 Tax=Lipomyces japonicus TaxID=56871 RepID=UPI0034CF3F62